MRAIVAGVAILASAAANAQTFNTVGWPNGATGKSAWYATQTWAPDRFQIVKSPVGYWGVPAVARVTVKPGDKVGGWSGERAEVTVMQDALGAAIVEQPRTTQYFAWSVFVPTDWQAPQVDPACTCAWGIMLQLHGPDAWTASPDIAFNLDSKFSVSINAGNIDTLGPFHSVTYPFTDASLNAGKWTDFVAGVNFAIDATGSVSVWRRNAGAASFTQVASIQNVATLQTKPSIPTTSNPYWKAGFYRSTSPTVTNRLFLTGIVRAPDFATAAAAAFGE